MGPMTRRMLMTSLADGESGPVLILAGEADLTSVAQLSAALSAQMGDGIRKVTVDISGLRFADAASVRSLMLAARMLTERGGQLLLLHPRAHVARVLELLGADQVIEVRDIETTRP